MPFRPAKVTQADVARTIRAAKQAGAESIEVRPDGTISIELGKGKGKGAQGSPASSDEPPAEDIVL